MPAVAACADHTGAVLLCLPQLSTSSAACPSCPSLLQVCIQDYQDAQGCRP